MQSVLLILRECGAITLATPIKLPLVDYFILTFIVDATGYLYEKDGNYTKTTFRVDPDYACTMFQSCKKVSIVA